MNNIARYEHGQFLVINAFAILGMGVSHLTSKVNTVARATPITNNDEN